jgi:hypothetical protein
LDLFEIGLIYLDILEVSDISEDIFTSFQISQVYNVSDVQTDSAYESNVAESQAAVSAATTPTVSNLNAETAERDSGTSGSTSGSAWRGWQS